MSSGGQQQLLDLGQQEYVVRTDVFLVLLSCMGTYMCGCMPVRMDVVAHCVLSRHNDGTLQDRIQELNDELTRAWKSVRYCTLLLYVFLRVSN